VRGSCQTPPHPAASPALASTLSPQGERVRKLAALYVAASMSVQSDRADAAMTAAAKPPSSRLRPFSRCRHSGSLLKSSAAQRRRTRRRGTTATSSARPGSPRPTMRSNWAARLAGQLTLLGMMDRLAPSAFASLKGGEGGRHALCNIRPRSGMASGSLLIEALEKLAAGLRRGRAA